MLMTCEKLKRVAGVMIVPLKVSQAPNPQTRFFPFVRAQRLLFPFPNFTFNRDKGRKRGMGGATGALKVCIHLSATDDRKVCSVSKCIEQN